MTSDLRLLAVDAEDLRIASAHCQDAVVRAADLSFEPRARRFVIPMNRFVWEKEAPRGWFGLPRRREHERRRAVLHFDRVSRVRRQGVPQDDPEAVLVLLAALFHEGDAPSGTVELVFAGGSTIRLEVECIEAQLADVGGAWGAASRPDHERSPG